MAVSASQRQPARASQRASLASQTEKQTEIEQRVSRAGSKVGRQQRTDGQPADQASRQPGCSSGQFAAGTVLRSVALLYESPGGNQVDGLLPAPTSSILQMRFQSDVIRIIFESNLARLAAFEAFFKWCKALSSIPLMSGGPWG